MGQKKGNWRTWPPERVEALLAFADTHGPAAAAREFGITPAAVAGHRFRARGHMKIVNVALDDEMHSRLMAYHHSSRQGTFAASFRDIVEWGLEVWEEEERDVTKTSTTRGA